MGPTRKRRVRAPAPTGEEALVGAEVMFDAKAVIEAELIAKSKLVLQFFITLMGRHSRFGPDMGKMGELHQRSLLS
jgi:hypothetical protein